MKKLITLFLVGFVTATCFAQAPDKMSYQAVIRDAGNNLLINTSIGIRVDIVIGSISGAIVYNEYQVVNTNDNGLLSIEIGAINSLFGIDWTSGPYFINTYIDPTGGTNFTIIGGSQLLSVPYALHAKTAENITGTISETDPIYSSSLASEITTSDTINWNNKLDTEVDGSITNEIQVLSLSNDTIYLSNGGFVKLPAGFDGQYSSLISAPTNVSAFTNDAGYLTSEIDSSVTNEIQVLSLSNDTIYLSNGGFVKLPTTNPWSLSGNTGTNPAFDFIGTSDNTPLIFKTNNQFSGGINPIKENVFFGHNSGNSTVSGTQNSGFGEGSLLKLTSGSNNSAFGLAALIENSTGYNNTALGYTSLYYNTTGHSNTAVGIWTSHFNTTGAENTAIGTSALNFNQTGNNNTVIGKEAGFNSIGSSNVFLGYQAGYNETGSNKLYIANSSTNPPLIYGDFASGFVGIGTNTPTYKMEVVGDALINLVRVGTGSGNVSSNTVLGVNGLSANSSGNVNTAIGYYALKENSTGAGNTALGAYALPLNHTGQRNTAVGAAALYMNNNNNNTSVGHSAGEFNDSGSNNVFIGYRAGRESYGSASNNVFIGYEAGFNETGSNKLYIANSSTNPPLIYGDFASGFVGLGTTNPTAKLEVQGGVKIVDGSEGANKILTSDANGLATWQAKESKAYGMIYRTSAFDIPAVTLWTDLPLDGGSNDLINVTHSTSTNAERVTVNVSGTYLIQYIVHFRRHTTPHHGVSRLIKNGSVEIPGSYTVASPISGDGNEEDPLSTQVITTLSANDYFNIQVATNTNVTDEVDSYYGPDLPVPTTKISVSITIVKIGE